MNKQQKQQMFSIRKKLLAAVAMLLVACIMTVSSTYAWFTLSTAPEVKGIATKVGANGNLEIALGTYGTIYGTAPVESNIGDSNQSATVKNLTWGNLIDLTDSSYGLGNIVLYPSRLNANGTSLQYLSPLKYPAYGADGRITELKTGTMLGKYGATGGFTGLPTPNDYAGVNAIGAASSMSEREFAITNNKAAIVSYSKAAENLAISAINVYGGALAKLALNNQDSVDEVVIAEADVAVLKALVTKLQEANENVGYSVRSAILVYLASEGSGLSDDLWKPLNTDFSTKTLEEINTSISELGGWPLTTQVYYNEYAAVKADLAAAAAALPASGDSTWGAVKGVVGNLLNASKIQICDKTVDEIMTAYRAHAGNVDPDPDTEDAFEYVARMAMGGNLVFGFADGSGIFSDIAKMTGEYTAYITFPQGVSVEAIPLSGLTRPVKVSPTTKAANSADDTTVGAAMLLGGMLPALTAATESLNAPDADANAVQALTDTFGYTLDFLFRTNATDSYLQLQTDAIDRIYSDNPADASTRGDGSYMAFEISEEYTTSRIQELMGAIRVVFYENPGAGRTTEILGVATVDTTAGANEAGSFRAPLKLMNYSIAADGQITFNGEAADAKLKALTANVATKITALVYLDGDQVDNAMVGIASNMTGSMNLQFSSSASLTPMEYNDLHTAA